MLVYYPVDSSYSHCLPVYIWYMMAFLIPVMIKLFYPSAAQAMKAHKTTTLYESF